MSKREMKRKNQLHKLTLLLDLMVSTAGNEMSLIICV